MPPRKTTPKPEVQPTLLSQGVPPQKRPHRIGPPVGSAAFGCACGPKNKGKCLTCLAKKVSRG